MHGKPSATTREDARSSFAIWPLRDFRASRSSVDRCWNTGSAKYGNGTVAAAPSHPPIGARTLVPQKICVPNIPMRFTSTRLSTIDFAVACAHADGAA